MKSTVFSKVFLLFVSSFLLVIMEACDQIIENHWNNSSTTKLKIDSVPKFPKGYYILEAETFHKSFKSDDFMQSPTGYYLSRMSEFYPMASIYRSGNISPLGNELNDEIGDFRSETHFGDLSLDKYVELGNCQGYLVIQHGQIVYENYHNSRALDKHLWNQNSCIVLSACVGLLEEEGKLDPSKGVGTYVSELNGTAWENIPVQDLLDMTSGIHCLDNDTSKIKKDKKPNYLFQVSTGMIADPLVYKLTKNVKSFLKTLQKSKPNGVKFEYSSANAQVLGWIIESITNIPYADYVSDKFWSRIGTEGDASIILSQAGTPVFGKGMNSNLRDMGRFAMLFTPSWYNITRNQILPKPFIDKIQKGGRKVMFSNSPEAEEYLKSFAGDAPVSNSRLFDLVWDDGDFWKSGGGDQGIYISPKRDLVIVYVGVNPDAHQTDLMHFTRELAKSNLFRKI